VPLSFIKIDFYYFVIHFLIKLRLFVLSPGFKGKNCEENIDDCPRNLCQNGATCVDDVNRYSCVCPPTFTGELCNRDVDECSLRPNVCQNGGTCSNTLGGYSCICVNGWTGHDCSVNIDDCANAVCFNGATCIDRVGSFYCQCTPGKTGEFHFGDFNEWFF
jgi:Notch 1